MNNSRDQSTDAFTSSSSSSSRPRNFQDILRFGLDIEEIMSRDILRFDLEVEQAMSLANPTFDNLREYATRSNEMTRAFYTDQYPGTAGAEGPPLPVPQSEVSSRFGAPLFEQSASLEKDQQGIPENLEDYKCPICWDVLIEATKANCGFGHTFCSYCINKWTAPESGMASFKSCPVCRTPISASASEALPGVDLDIAQLYSTLPQKIKDMRADAVKERSSALVAESDKLLNHRQMRSFSLHSHSIGPEGSYQDDEDDFGLGNLETRYRRYRESLTSGGDILPFEQFEFESLRDYRMPIEEYALLALAASEMSERV